MSDSNKPPTPTELTRYWANEAASQMRRADTAEMERDAWRTKFRQIEDELNTYRRGVMAAQGHLEAKLALVERYGADQWRRGNAGKDPQEFEEWRREVQP
jgi:hypothetical protein